MPSSDKKDFLLHILAYFQQGAEGSKSAYQIEQCHLEDKISSKTLTALMI